MAAQIGRINGPALADNLSREGVGGATFAFETDLLIVDPGNGLISTSGALNTSASTTARAGLNVLPGVAPTVPVDGDMWVTAAGEFNVRANGATINAASGGDVVKVGTPLNDQIGVWTGDGTLEGDTGLLWNGALFSVRSATATMATFTDTGGSSASNTDARINFAYGASDTAVGTIRYSSGDLRIINTFGMIELTPGVTSGQQLVELVNSGLQFNERADHAAGFTGGKAEVWLRNDAPTTLMYTDDIGADYIIAGAAAPAGDVTKIGTPANDEIGVWTGDGTLEGETNLKWTSPYLRIAETWGLRATSTTAFQLDSADATTSIVSIRSSDGLVTSIGGTETIASMTTPSGEDGLRLTINGAADLLYNNSVKLSTTNIGIDVTGHVNASVEYLFTEQADHVFTPVATRGIVWVRDDAPNTLMFTDDGGADYVAAGALTFPTFKSYSATGLSTGATYVGGFYNFAAADANLTIGGTVTQTFGTAGESHAAHAFCVASGAGGTDLVLTVTGVSITDAGVRNDADSEIIVADTDTATTNQYFETSKKWLGQITYTLTGAAGSFDFNYGFVKYDDFGNRDFTLTDFEATGYAEAAETGLDIELLHHEPTAFVYNATAFDPNTTALISLSTDYGTNDDVANDNNFAFKRAGLATAISGSASEGLIIRVNTATNNSMAYMNFHIGAVIS